MAVFTMTLKDVIESVYGESMDPDDYEQTYGEFNFDGVTYGKLPTVPNPELIGLGTYPIFDSAYRNILNGKIIDHYYNREIGLETIDMFNLAIRRKMDQVMPYFNKLYKSEQIDYEALDTMRIHSEGTDSSEETSHNDTEADTVSETDSKSRAVNSNTPQMLLAGNKDYASGAADTISDSDVSATSSQESTTNSSSDNQRESLVTGYQGIASDLVMRYRNSLLNIDTLILDELQECFMGVFDNGDSYFDHYAYQFGW